MKKKFFAVVVLIVVMAACASTGASPQFSDITGKEWKLIEVYINGKSINFNRNALNNNGFRELFTLSFNPENISGVGSPNLYSALYTQEENRTINIKLARSTLMAPLFEQDQLKEHDFFTYIQNINTWNLVNKNLELHSKTGEGAKVVMVFSL